MARLKLIKKGKVSWGNVAKQMSRDGTKNRKKRERERAKLAREREKSAAQTRKKNERERAKLAREREKSAAQARKKNERERAKLAREREKSAAQALKRRERENTTQSREHKKASDTLGKKRDQEIKVASRERDLLTKENKKAKAAKVKHILRLNGLFLEYAIPINSFDNDLREIAYHYELDNGLTTASQFKKVTLPYLEKNLWKEVQVHVRNEAFIRFRKAITVVLKEGIVEKVIRDLFFDSKEFIKLKKEFLEDSSKKLPGNLDLDKFEAFKNPISNKYIHDFIEKHLDLLEITNSIKKKEEKRKQEEEEKKKQEEERKKQEEEKKKQEELTKKAVLSIKTTHDKKLGRALELRELVSTKIQEEKKEIESVKALAEATFFKGKHIKKGQELATHIWERTLPLLELNLFVNEAIRELRSPPEDNIGYTRLRENGILDDLLEKYLSLDKSLNTSFQMRLTNLTNALEFYDKEKRLIALRGMKKKLQNAKGMATHSEDGQDPLYELIEKELT